MQSEKIKWQSQYMKYHNENPFIAGTYPYEKTETKLILKEVPEYCLNIIDFCCGTGRIATILASEKRKILALDQSQGSLVKISNPNISQVCCIAQGAPIKGNWADCILFIQAFQYVPLEDHNVVLKELNRLLKKDGILIISTFCYDSIFLRAIHIFLKNKWKRDGEEFGSNGFRLPYHRFMKSEIVMKLCDAGFEITSMQLIKNYPFYLLSSNIDYLIAKSGLKLFGAQIIISAKKVGD